MSKKVEIEVTEFPEDLYSNFPSRYKVSLTDVPKWSPLSFISGVGSTPEEAVERFSRAYTDHLKREADQDRWLRIYKSGTLLETREVEL